MMFLVRTIESDTASARTIGLSQCLGEQSRRGRQQREANDSLADTRIAHSAVKGKPAKIEANLINSGYMVAIKDPQEDPMLAGGSYSRASTSSKITTKLSGMYEIRRVL